ncbi:tungsten formylmethanofuran dehydrogenase [Candidatus Omnitrophota bacterium]
MPRIEIDRERCKGCELCILYCQKKCIELDSSINKKGVHPVSFSDKGKKCTGCFFCALTCPEVCITVYK